MKKFFRKKTIAKGFSLQSLKKDYINPSTRASPNIAPKFNPLQSRSLVISGKLNPQFSFLIPFLGDENYRKFQ